MEANEKTVTENSTKITVNVRSKIENLNMWCTAFYMFDSAASMLNIDGTKIMSKGIGYQILDPDKETYQKLTKLVNDLNELCGTHFWIEIVKEELIRTITEVGED